MNPDIAKLLAAAARVHAGEALTTELLADAGVPVDLRLLVAATALAAADLTSHEAVDDRVRACRPVRRLPGPQ